MLTAMCDVMKEAYRRGWITTRDGNVSVRKGGEDKIYLTPAGVRKNVVNVEMLVRMNIGEEPRFFSKMNLSPTGEWDMHWIVTGKHQRELSIFYLLPLF